MVGVSLGDEGWIPHRLSCSGIEWLRVTHQSRPTKPEFKRMQARTQPPMQARGFIGESTREDQSRLIRGVIPSRVQMPEGRQTDARGKAEGRPSGMAGQVLWVARAVGQGSPTCEQLLTGRVNEAKVGCMNLSANESTNRGLRCERTTNEQARQTHRTAGE